MSRKAGDMQQQAEYFVGLDWGGARHTVAVANARREIVARFSVANSLEGVCELVRRLQEWAPVAGVAVEATRDPVVLYLYNAGFTIYPVNPKVSKNWRAGLSPAESKSDGRDARMLAVELCRRHEELHALHVSEPAIEAFAGLCRTHRRLIEQRANLVQQLKGVLKIYFAAALAFFSDWASPAAWRFIKRFATPQKLANTRKSTLIAFLRANQIGLTPTWLKRIDERLQAADWPTPPDHLAYEFQAMAIVAQLLALQPQIDKCAREIAQRAEAFPETALMHSLPGAGKHLAPALAAMSLKTAGQPHRLAFLRAAAGVAPVERDSGKRSAPYAAAATRFGAPPCTCSPIAPSITAPGRAPSTGYAANAATPTPRRCANSPTNGCASSTACWRPDNPTTSSATWRPSGGAAAPSTTKRANWLWKTPHEKLEPAA